ncbi:hypothetical protein [Bacillus sp. SM2101]|nr:hypothetical protein [Bacillus sp. SM2101]
MMGKKKDEYSAIGDVAKDKTTNTFYVIDSWGEGVLSPTYL